MELLEDPHEDRINEVAEQLGLRRVGWIFTDLVARDLKTGSVKHFRGNIVRNLVSTFFFPYWCISASSCCPLYLCLVFCTLAVEEAKSAIEDPLFCIS